MALDERSNRYIKFFQNIRLIQASLTADADKYMIPKIDNTNVDRSINKKKRMLTSI
jgi:2-phosphoglycerate kinase